MVKIRYSELPAGLHVAAAADREGTVVYLQPGLTSAQRRAALFRVRSSARIGQGPTLPGPAMARAIAADRVRMNARIGAAAARRHPLLFVPPVILLLVSATVFLFMSIQPLTAATRGNVVGAVPGLPIGGSLLRPSLRAQPPAQQHRHHRLYGAEAAGLTYPSHVQPALPPACAGLQASLRPGSRSTSASVKALCGRPGHFQHWAPTYRY